MSIPKFKHTMYKLETCEVKGHVSGFMLNRDVQKRILTNLKNGKIREFLRILEL